MQVSTVGLDLAKHVFQAHGVDAAGAVVLRRAQVIPFFAGLAPCLVALEACATSHHWARELAGLGHAVRLLPPAYVKAYVRRGKTDAADAAAICEAATRPGMRFVPVKAAEQQAALMLHRGRDLLVRQRTMLANALRGHLAEFGIVAGQGRAQLRELVGLIEAADERLPALARRALGPLAAQLGEVERRIDELGREIEAWHRASAASRRLATIAGLGPIAASAIAASVPDASQFRSGREFSAWLGLTPKAHSSGGKQRQGAISKQGDRYLRRLLVLGATAALRHPQTRARAGGAWLEGLLARKPARVAIVALANKLARIAWAVLSREEAFRPHVAKAAA